MMHTTKPLTSYILPLRSTPDIHDPLMTSLKLLTGDSFDNFHHRLRRSASVCVGGGTTYLGT